MKFGFILYHTLTSTQKDEKLKQIKNFKRLETLGARIVIHELHVATWDA